VLFLTINEFESKDKIFISKSAYSSKIKIHAHKFFEIVYIYKGSGKHIINGERYDAAHGSLFFLDYNVNHYFIPSSDDFSLLNCVFLTSAIDENLFCVEDIYGLLDLPFFDIYNKEDISYQNCLVLYDQYGIEQILFSMYDEYAEKKKGYHVILQQYLIILLNKIFRNAGSREGELLYDKNKAIIYTALNYIDDHFNRPLSLNEIAKYSMLSPSYFSTLFKNIMGYNLFNYVKRLRINEACNQLKQTHKNIENIMFDVGYNDFKYFYKIFKLHTGTTPGQYRKANHDMPNQH